MQTNDMIVFKFTVNKEKRKNNLFNISNLETNKF